MTSQAPLKPKQKKDARDIRADAAKITNAIKIDGQTSAETRAIANGIQRGMELFLRQQSEKARELDKRTKKVKQLANQLTQQKPDEEKEVVSTQQKQPLLPWILLIASWILFLVFEAARIYI
jgi:Protein of unknown function (DUF2956)